jgi:hypothetical protein
VGRQWSVRVAIYRIFERRPFLPEDVRRLGDAYEMALTELGITNRTNPITETIAQHIIEIGQTGEQDPARICDLTIKRVQGK